MGKLRKIGRKIDRGLRKVFGKDGWLKAAATVAAIYFAAPVFGSGAMSFKPAATAASVPISSVTATAADSAALSSKNFPARESLLEAWENSPTITPKETGAPKLRKAFKSMTESSSDFFANMLGDAFKVGVYGQLVGDDEFIGSTKGVQQIAADEPSLIGELQNFMSSNPQAMPTTAVPTVQPVFATANIG